MQVVTRSPGVYRTFLAISAEEHPTLGSVERTISQGFGGDRAAYEANDPLSLMSSAPPGRYNGIAGIVSVGRQDTSYRGAVPVLAEAATRAGMTVSTRQYDRRPHLGRVGAGAGRPARLAGRAPGYRLAVAGLLIPARPPRHCWSAGRATRLPGLPGYSALSATAARPASRRATGTRKGEQET